MSNVHDMFGPVLFPHVCHWEAISLGRGVFGGIGKVIMLPDTVLVIKLVNVILVLSAVKYVLGTIRLPDKPNWVRRGLWRRSASDGGAYVSIAPLTVIKEFVNAVIVADIYDMLGILLRPYKRTRSRNGGRRRKSQRRGSNGGTGEIGPVPRATVRVRVDVVHMTIVAYEHEVNRIIDTPETHRVSWGHNGLVESGKIRDINILPLKGKWLSYLNRPKRPD